nr:hypothetical protein [Tanacetum cinerariifolium]
AAAAMLMVGVVFGGGSGVDGDDAWGRVDPLIDSGDCRVQVHTRLISDT